MAMTLYRGMAEDIGLDDWLNTLWLVESKYTAPGTVFLGASLAICEMLRSGITSALDMYWYPESAAQAAAGMGFRLVTGPVFFDPPGADRMDFGQRREQAIQFLEAYRKHPLIRVCVQPHGAYTVAPENLIYAYELAAQNDALFHTHASETVNEANMVRSQYGLTPVQHLNQLGLLGSRTLLAHAVHISEEEIEILASTGTSVSHNPQSNFKLASGVAPVTRLIEKGVRVSLGTDGACSGNDLDLWKAMRMAAMMQKICHNDPTVAGARQMVRMATIEGAHALGLGAITGSLEVGKRADMIVIDLNQAHLVPLYDPYAQLVYAVGRGDVCSVLINGRKVMDDYHLLSVDEKEILMAVRAFSDQVGRSSS